MTTPNPARLAENERFVRALAERWNSGKVPDPVLADILAEYDRRGTELTRMRVYYTGLIMDVVDAAGWTGDDFAGLGDHIAELAGRSAQSSAMDAP